MQPNCHLPLTDMASIRVSMQPNLSLPMIWGLGTSELQQPAPGLSMHYRRSGSWSSDADLGMLLLEVASISLSFLRPIVRAGEYGSQVNHFWQKKVYFKVEINGQISPWE